MDSSLLAQDNPQPDAAPRNSEDDVDAAWLTAVLRKGGIIGSDESVTSLEKEPLVHGGQTGSPLLRLTPQYSSSAIGGAPKTLIVKLSGHDSLVAEGMVKPYAAMVDSCCLRCCFSCWVCCWCSVNCVPQEQKYAGRVGFESAWRAEVLSYLRVAPVMKELAPGVHLPTVFGAGIVDDGVSTYESCEFCCKGAKETYGYMLIEDCSAGRRS